MEKKLSEYRAQKARQEKIDEIKSKTKQLLGKLWDTPENKADPTHGEPLLQPEDETSIDETLSDDASLDCFSYTDLVYYLLCFTLWAIVYAIFIQFEFGTVFLVLSAILFMYFNTRTGPKRAGEVSAYSVFNKNCESINGTLKAEQFEREIRYGPAGVH